MTEAKISISGGSLSQSLMIHLGKAQATNASVTVFFLKKDLGTHYLMREGVQKGKGGRGWAVGGHRYLHISHYYFSFKCQNYIQK